MLWSVGAPWTITRAGPAPSTQTARGVPSGERTSMRVPMLPLSLVALIVSSCGS